MIFLLLPHYLFVLPPLKGSGTTLLSLYPLYCVALCSLFSVSFCMEVDVTATRGSADPSLIKYIGRVPVVPAGCVCRGRGARGWPMSCHFLPWKRTQNTPTHRHHFSISAQPALCRTDSGLVLHPETNSNTIFCLKQTTQTSTASVNASLFIALLLLLLYLHNHIFYCVPLLCIFAVTLHG